MPNYCRSPKRSRRPIRRSWPPRWPTRYASGTPVYPIGGGTSLDFGLTAAQPGIGLSLAGLDRVVDYPARDMTITVEAGITMDAAGRDAGGRAAVAADRRAARRHGDARRRDRHDLERRRGAMATARCAIT